MRRTPGWALPGAARVACGYRQGGLSYRQGAVDVDHRVVREVHAGRYRNDRVGTYRELGVAVVLGWAVKVSPLTAPVADALKVGLAAP